MVMPSSVPQSFIGRVLAERYRLESVLGTGGMGAVYQARDIKTDATLAVKVIHQLGPGSEEFHQRFFDEAMIIGELFHPNTYLWQQSVIVSMIYDGERPARTALGSVIEAHLHPVSGPPTDHAKGPGKARRWAK